MPSKTLPSLIFQRAMGANPSASTSVTIDADAASSLLDTNITRSPPFSAGFIANSLAGSWLSVLTTFAPGNAQATTSLEAYCVREVSKTVAALIGLLKEWVEGDD